MPTATPFNNLITFSRGSNATVTGSNGLIQWAPNNLLTFSEQFDNAAWSTYFVTVAANTTVAPDGSRTADTLTFAPSVIDYHSVFRTVAVAAGLLYTTSVYAKAGTTSVFSMEFRGSSSAPDVVFNLANGTVTSGTGTITPVGDGWYRCSVTKTSVDASELIIFGTGLISAAGTIFLWGAQLELGSTATTYNPTTVKNLISFSEAFDNAGWTKGNASVVTGAQANPINGLFNAQKLMENTANAQHLLSQNYVAGAGVYTYSIYVKAAERDIFGFNRTDIGGFSASYNLTTGTVRSISGFTNAQIIAVGGGWYRVSCMLTLAAGTTIGFGVQPYNAVGSTVYTGDGNSGVYIYGAQLSDSASLDPYVPAPGLTASSTAFYGPRFDFDPVTRQPRGILIEEQRTNRTFQSENFTVSPWDATIGGTSTRVNGTNALGFTEGIITATSAGGGIRQQHPGLTSGQVYALSFYIQSTATAVNMLFENSTASFGAPHSVVINPSNGTVGALTGFTSASVQPFGPGYIYTLITAPAGGALLANIEWRILNSGDVIRLGRPQFEAGAFATSYIPTVASTVTRSADVATITGQNFAQWYNQPRGTFVMNFTPDGGLTSASTRVLSVSSGGVSNRVVDVNFSGGSWTNYNGTATLAIGPAAVTTIPQRIAAAYATANYGYTLNGGTVVADTSVLVNSPTQLNLGYLDTGNYLNGHIRSINFIPARAADFQLQALTELPLVPTLDLDFLNNLYEA